MEKIIKIDKETSLKLSNNVSWLFTYRAQFGQDIVVSLVPALNAGVQLAAQVAGHMKDGRLTAEIFKEIPPEELQNAIIELSGLESVDLIRIVWAMAKAADDSIEPPEIWLKQFNVFPLDLILPEVVSLAAQGFISSKNLKRLRKVPEAEKE